MKKNQTNKIETQSVHLRLKEDLLDEIDNFTKDLHFSNRTEAMRYLLALGLKYQNIANNLMRKMPLDPPDSTENK